VLLHGGLITAATLTAFFWGLSAAPDRAPTIAFMTLAFAQMAHLGNARQRGAVLSLRRATANRFALLGVGIAAALQMAAYLIPAASRLLGIARLDRREWAVVVALSLAPAVLVQAGRLLGRRR
jgi:Ca2+-transporting ATPase